MDGVMWVFEITNTADESTGMPGKAGKLCNLTVEDSVYPDHSSIRALVGWPAGTMNKIAQLG